MTHRLPNERELSRKNLTALRRAYRTRPMVLYLGAGVSMGDRNSDLQFPAWLPLIRQVLLKARPNCSKADLARLKRLRDPWKAADFARAKCGGSRFQQALRAIVQDRSRFPKPKGSKSSATKTSPNAKKQLGGAYLSGNSTLNAVVAFCGSLIGRTEQEKGAKRLQYRAAPNPRIRAVLTANYDPFLEAASSSKFKTALLKPVAAYGSDSGNLRQLPVFHIHGYVPHPDQPVQRRDRVPWHRRLILDSKSYLKAWDSTDVFGPTMAPQIHYLRHYTTLFIGFSFADKKVRELLRKICAEPNKPGTKDTRSHFAFVHVDDFRRRSEGFYDAMGVRPILFDSPGDIVKALAGIYCAGLNEDFPGMSVPIYRYAKGGRKPLAGRPYRIDKKICWEVLLKCRNTAVPAKTVSVRGKSLR